jgi:transcriptional regulator with XRE-family HTH domain
VWGVRSGSLVRRRQLARTLRELRVHAGLTIEAAAPLLDFSPSKLSRIENAHQGVDVHIVRSMLDLFDVGGERWTELLELTRAAGAKGWWRAYGLDDKGYLPLEEGPLPHPAPPLRAGVARLPRRRPCAGVPVDDRRFSALSVTATAVSALDLRSPRPADKEEAGIRAGEFEA